MIEKFSDYEGSAFLSEAGTFEFTVEDAEVTESKSGNTMVKFTFKCDKGTTNAYHVLSPNARWTYNKLIAAALKLTEKQKKTTKTIANQLHPVLLQPKPPIIGVYPHVLHPPQPNGLLTYPLQL